MKKQSTAQNDKKDTSTAFNQIQNILDSVTVGVDSCVNSPECTDVSHVPATLKVQPKI